MFFHTDASAAPPLIQIKTIMFTLAWICNPTFIPMESALVDSGYHNHACDLDNVCDRPWELQHSRKVWGLCCKGYKISPICSLCLHSLSEAHASLSTLLAVAVEMKYWPPESHLAPNWAILLLFSPFRVWLSLLHGGWLEAGVNDCLTVGVCT